VNFSYKFKSEVNDREVTFATNYLLSCNFIYYGVTLEKVDLTNTLNNSFLLQTLKQKLKH
jgi:hypothetical protein